MTVTPSMLSALDPSQEYSAVRSVFMGGEAPSDRLIAKWATPGRALYNCYGPTETTCTSLIQKLTPSEPVVLGHPMVGSDVILLDEFLQESNQGELCISGPGLARGYFENEALTREKFIIFEPTQERYYRTGDIARRTVSGLQFLGRNDFVVKNRGFLINLGADVRPALLSCPGVDEATAIMHRDNLIGFVTPGTVSGPKIREDLAARLDAFLVPERIYALDRFPVTANDKVDPRALESWLNEQTKTVDDQTSTSDATSTPFETLVHAVSSALSIAPQQVSLSSSFWGLGGNSLLAIRLMSELKRHGFTIPSIKMLYKRPLTDLLPSLTHFRDPDEALTNGHANGISHTDSTGSAPTTMQQKLLRATMSYPALNHLLVTIRIRHENQPFDLDRLRQAFLYLFQRHAIFRTAFDAHLQTQIIEEEPSLEYKQDICTVEDLDETISRCENILLGNVCGGSHYNTDKIWPLKSLRVISAPYQVTNILWCVHHSLTDGWSTQLIIDELEAFLNCQEMPELAPGFDQVSRIQNNLMAKAADVDMDFWKNSLEDFLPANPLHLPSQHGDAASDDFWPEESSILQCGQTRLRTLSSQLSVSEATVVYGTWAMLLSRYVSSTRVIFGTVLSGRDIDLINADRIVGPMINVCPFPIEIDEEQSVAAFLAGVQEKLLNIQEFQWSASKYLTENISSTLQSDMFSSLVAMQVNLQNRFGNSRHRTYDWDWTLKAKSEFPLTLVVEEQGDECLRIRIVYDHQRLGKNYVKTLVNHYQNIVDQVLQSDKSTVGRVLGRMMDPDEYRRLTRPHDQFYTHFEGADNLVTAICNAVRQWPNLVAVQSGREALTYMELDDVSSRAACGLKEILAEGENVVSVMSDGSIEWTICILAVLKAGAAYCPIDVKLPAERMSTMISESNSSVILCPNIPSREAYQQEPTRPVILLEDLNPVAVNVMSDALSVKTTRGGTACIIFTSGSTGVPKGKPARIFRVTYRVPN